MDEQPDDRGTKRYQALRDRYPATRDAQDRTALEEIRALRQGLRELSDIVSSLAVYLIDISGQADAGNTAEEPQNREQLRVLGEEAAAIRERFPKEHP